MAKLLNGDGYRGITAQEDADLYAGIIGNGRLLLNVGKKMAAEIVDNNTIRIYDGELVSKGRRIHIDAGTWDDFTIPTGSQGVTKYFTIGYRLYTNGAGSQVCEQAVKTDTSVVNYEEASLRNEAAEAYVAIYRVKQDGINLTGVTALYDMVLSAAEVQAKIFDTGWLTPTFDPNTSNPTAGTKIRYRKKNGIVYVQGTIGIKDLQNNFALFNLPEGYRSGCNFYSVNTATAYKMSRYYISTSGNVSLEWVQDLSTGDKVTGQVNWIGIDVSFPAQEVS